MGCQHVLSMCLSYLTSSYCPLTTEMTKILSAVVLLCLCSSVSLVNSKAAPTTWDPWTPCTDDSDCPDGLMCNYWQSRCTECVDNEDCPPCIAEDCPFQGDGVCVYGDHCCTPHY